MKKRVFKGLFLQSCIILFLSVTFLLGMLYSYFSRLSKDEIRAELNYVGNGVEQSGLEYLETLDSLNGRITWISANGVILFDSEKDKEAMENHGDREEFIQALSEGNGESYRYSQTLGEMSYYCAKKLSDNSVIRISGTRYTIISLVMGMAIPLVCVLVIAFIISLILSRKISEKVVSPINNIDIDNIEVANTYEELAPFIEKISYQNKKIKSQFYELQKKQQEFDTITENMSEGLIAVDKNADVIFYNNSALRIFNMNADLISHSVFILHKKIEFEEVVNRALDGEHSECNITFDNRTYQVMANPVYHEEKLSGGIIIIMDITEKEERENLRREFSANVSHELKTPLTSISGFAEIMKSGMAKEEDMKRFAGNIYNEAKRMIALVGDIIKLSKFDEGSEVAEFTDVDVAAVVNENIERMMGQAESKNVEIHSECENININAHYGVIDEMIYNLMENAIKYNKENGKVTVSWKSLGEKMELIVEDTGIGIPYADQSRVFERFYRVEKSHSKEIGGTGLGLSIVKHGAAMHDAKLELSSEPDKGTKIKIIFNK